MRKWIIVVIVFAAILVGATPALTGIIAEKKIKNLADQISHQDSIKLAVVDYKRGWFHTTAKFNLTIDTNTINRFKQFSPNEKITPMVFESMVTINHGPVIFNNGLQFGLATANSNANLSPETISALKNNFKEGHFPQLNTQLILKFDGQFVIDSQLPELTFVSNDQNTELHIQQLNGTWRMNRRAIIGEMKAAKWMHTANATAAADREQTTITQPKISFQQVEMKIDNKYPVWIGNNLMQADELKAEKNDRQTVIKNILISEDKNLQTDQTIKATASLTFNQLSMNHQNYGPGRIVTETNQLDGVAYSELQQQFSQIRKQKNDLQSAVFTMLPTFHQLFFQQGAKLEIKIAEIVTPDGMMRAKGFLQFVKDQNSPDKNANSHQNPFQWFSDMTKNIKFNLNVVSPIAATQKLMTQVILNHTQQPQNNNGLPMSVPAVTATNAEQSAKQQLNNWVNNGSLLEKNGQYELTFNYENKDFTINGKPLNAIQNQNPPAATAATTPAVNPLVPSVAQQQPAPSNVQVPLKPQTVIQ